MSGAQSYPALESILLIDDSLTVRVFVDKVLSDAGYRVTTASSAAAGLDALAGCNPDVILLDVRMPGTDPVDVATAIHQRDVVGETVILLYSGRSAPDQDALVTRCGARGYVCKSRDADQLVHTIEDAWQRVHHRSAGT